MADIRTARPSCARSQARLTYLLLALASTVALAAGPQLPDARRIERVLSQTPLIDGHNDLPWEIRERFGGDLTRICLLYTSPSPRD